MSTAPKIISQQASGNKKTAVASVRISLAKKGSFVINGKDSFEYLQRRELLKTIALSPFTLIDVDPAGFEIIVKAIGSGHSSQSYAIRHAIAQVLVNLFPEKKSLIKSAGFLTRDARIVERKKPGLRKARRKEQFSKR